jgi:hypothetical protein
MVVKKVGKRKKEGRVEKREEEKMQGKKEVR